MTSEDSHDPCPSGSARAARWLAAFAGLTTMILVTPALGTDGFVGGRERDLLDRVDAAAGVPLEDLATSPVVPDAFASLSVALFGAAWGLRIPGALAAAFMVGASCWLGTRIWRDPWRGALAGAITLSCPSLLYAARIAVPELWGGCAVVGTLLLVYAWSEAVVDRPSRALMLGVALSAALSIACLGVILGGALPCLVSATLIRGPRARRALLLTAGLLGLVGAVLAHLQGDGFIPALAASKDLKLMDLPSRRSLAASLVEHLHGSFPWAPLALAGVLTLSGSRAWFGLWWMGGLLIYSGWTAMYGASPMALEVPMALSAVACLDAHTRSSPAARAHGLLAVVVIVAALVLMADLSRAPYSALIPAYDRPPWIGDVSAPPLLTRSSSWVHRAVLTLFGVMLVLPRPSRSAFARPLFAGWCLLALGYASVWTHGPLEHARSMRSLSPAIHRFTSLLDDGVVESHLGTHRVLTRALRVAVRDRNVELVPFEVRSKAAKWIHQDVPRALLITASDVPSLYAVDARAQHPVYVLDRTHPQVWLVANVLPKDTEDLSPVPHVLLDRAPGTGTASGVQFDDTLELLEWELIGEPRLGSTVQLRLIFRAKKRMPRSAKIVARLKHGRISRIHERPEPFAGDLYPPNLWRHGDVIVHETEIELSPLVAFSGTHDLIVTVYERDKQPLSARLPGAHSDAAPSDKGDEAPPGDVASVPQNDAVPHGPRIIGGKKEKVILGQIEVLPRL